jgi:hypothetical protein
MKKASIAISAVLAFSIHAVRADDEPKVVAQPLHIGALQEFGMVQEGLYYAGTEKSELRGNDWFDHFGAFLTKDVTIDDRLHLSGGIGGVFQFRKPETPGLGFKFHQRKGFFVGPTKAEVVYDFGEVGKPWLQVGAGMFGYKYNPEAYNLGEYLFRSGAYPTYQYTGGYVFVNSAGAQLQGLRTHMDLGNFKYDMLLFTETGLAPMYDWSWGHVVSYNVGEGLLSLGAGVNFQRLISVRPSRTANPAFANSYFDAAGETWVGHKEFYERPGLFYGVKADQLSAKDSAGNAVQIAQYRALAESYAKKAAFVDSIGSLPDAAKPSLKHYSAAGILVMARATVDPKKLIGEGLFGKEDLKLYTEIDILGVQNYPVFYEKVTDRMPIMVGFNLPGFNFLDLIAVQGEYIHSPWLNNTYHRGRDGMNIPYFPDPGDKNLSEADYNDVAAKDDIKWTLQVKKNLGKAVSLWAQASRDHLRVPSSLYFYGPQFDHNEVTMRGKQWYWMAQISWGI